MWDRVLAFLGYEEEPEEQDVAEEVAPAVAVAQRYAAPVSRADVARRRAGGRPSWGEDRSERSERLSGRPATVTRLVPSGFPGMVVAAPKRFEESEEIVAHLKGGKPVLLHTDGLDRELGQRLVTFLMGGVCALGGEMHRVGTVFLFVPSGVEVTLPLALRIGEREGR